MPRTTGLSGSSRVWFMRRKPSDWTVARISGRAPIALFMRVALRVLSGTLRPSGGCRRHLPTLWGRDAFVGSRQPLADHLLDLAAAQLRDLRGRLELLQRGQRGANGVDRVALGDVHPFADRLGHLSRLADARADTPVHVADHDQRAERELAAALDD